MVREFKLPDVGEGVAEGEIVSWLVEAGDAVSEDQPVVEVETDKAIVEVPAPVDGTVRELLADEGDVVPVGNVIITFNVEGEDEPDAQPEPAAEEAETEPAEEAEAEEPEAAPESTGTGRVFAAPSARRLARELGVDIATVEGTGPSGRVTDQDVRAAAEAGEEAAAAEEETEVAAEPAETAETESETGTGAQPAQPAAVESADRDRTLAAPATRKLAEEQGIDIDAVPATEERDGQAFVTPEAVTRYAETQQQAKAVETEALAAGETGPLEERVPYRGVRKAIGDQMEESMYTAPHVTHHDTVTISELVETRSELKEVAEAQGVKLSYMPFVMKAIVAALKEFPFLNASLDEENGEIVLKNYYNIGIAVATDAGLMVPVVRDVDKKDMLQLASEVNELAQKARDRSISLEEMQGSTFTITNFGVVGGEYATPIINYPEVAIMGLGAIEKRPVVENDEVVARETLPLSVSIDHRIIDGAVVGQFTNKVMEYLHNPKLLLLE